jgi:hypothetical protein
MITEQLIQQAVKYLKDSAEPASQARAEYSYLVDYTKHLKSRLAKSFDGSNANQIMQAEASEEYLDHLKAVRIAEEEDQLYRHKIHAADVIVDCWRSEAATERALGKIQ